MKSNPVPNADPVNNTSGSAPAANLFESDDVHAVWTARVADYEQEVQQTSDPFAALSGLMHAELHRDAYALESITRCLMMSGTTPAERLQQTAPEMRTYLGIIRRITRHAAEELHERRAR